MTQREIDSLVAEATGEDLGEIRHRGFSIADPDDVLFDPEPLDREPQFVDWDTVELQRNVALFEQWPLCCA